MLLPAIAIIAASLTFPTHVPKQREIENPRRSSVFRRLACAEPALAERLSTLRSQHHATGIE